MIIDILDTEVYTPTISNNIKQKLVFADDIIGSFMPLFSDEIDRKKRLLDNIKKDHQHLKQSIAQGKNTLVEINNALKKERLIKAILIEINKMINSDVLYGNNKQIVASLLSNIETLDVDDLTTHLESLRSKTTKTINSKER